VFLARLCAPAQSAGDSPALHPSPFAPSCRRAAAHADRSGPGPYQEAVFSILTTADGGARNLSCVSTDAFCATGAAYFEPGVEWNSWRLWLDQDLAIDYGRELLGADKFKTERSMRTEAGVRKVTVKGVLEASIVLPTALDNLKSLPALARE
jgi:hypothetical protein